LVIADFEYSHDGELFYLTTVVCHVRWHFAARVGCRGGAVRYVNTAQDIQPTHNVTLRRVHATIFEVENPSVLHIASVCL